MSVIPTCLAAGTVFGTARRGADGDERRAAGRSGRYDALPDGRTITLYGRPAGRP